MIVDDKLIDAEKERETVDGWTNRQMIDRCVYLNQLYVSSVHSQGIPHTSHKKAFQKGTS